MKRKLLGILLTMIMGMSLLVGCGENTNETTDNVNSAVEDQESDTNTIGDENPFGEYTFSLCWDEDLKQSAVVSYNPEKVKLTKLSRNGAHFRWLDRKSVELLLMCEKDNSSVEDLYEKKMKIHEDNM